MATATREPSLIGKIFYAIADVIRGIREVFASLIYGPDVIKTFYPEYNKPYEHLYVQPQAQNNDNSKEVFQKFHKQKEQQKTLEQSQKKLREKDPSKQPQNPLQKEPPQNADKQPLSPNPKTDTKEDIKKTDVSIQETSESFSLSAQTNTIGLQLPDDITLGLGCTPINEMDKTEFENTLESEIKQEIRMNPDFGFVEVGGKVFTYEGHTTIEVPNCSIITVNDYDTGFKIATFEQTLTVAEDGNRFLSVEMIDMDTDSLRDWHLEAVLTETQHSKLEDDNDLFITENTQLEESTLPIPDTLKHSFNNEAIEICEIDEANDYPFLEADLISPQNTIEPPDDYELNAIEIYDTESVLPSLEVLVKMAEKGEIENLSQFTQAYTSESLASLKDEIKIRQLTASVGITRCNLEKAMTAIEWQEHNLGKKYIVPTEDTPQKFSIPEPKNNESFDDWEY